MVKHCQLVTGKMKKLMVLMGDGNMKVSILQICGCQPVLMTVLYGKV